MAQGSRPDRVGEEIRQELSTLLLREVHDPGIGFVTLTRVKVSPDLQLVRVYYTQLGDEKARKRHGARPRTRDAVPAPPDRQPGPAAARARVALRVRRERRASGPDRTHSPRAPERARAARPRRPAGRQATTGPEPKAQGPASKAQGRGPEAQGRLPGPEKDRVLNGSALDVARALAIASRSS